MEELSNPDIELNSRKNDGVTVSLWWKPDSTETYVSVVDERTCESHIIPVEASQEAHEVFNHPYAYLGRTTVEQAGASLGKD